MIKLLPLLVPLQRALSRHTVRAGCLTFADVILKSLARIQLAIAQLEEVHLPLVQLANRIEDFLQRGG
uniref:Putative secreted protein n=1 Tax=Anopheles marajoara TaxID=58244 RepID=A0A2M4CFU6_9DIPT